MNTIKPIAKRWRHVTCPSCAVLVVNGVICHEHGCPDAWHDEVRECRWCGSDFRPKDRWQRFCDDSCAESYNA